MMYKTVFVGVVAFAAATPGVSQPGNAAELTRHEVIVLAMEVNPELEVARQTWKASLARARQVSALPEPEFELEYEETPGVTQLQSYGQRAIGASQTIPSPLTWGLNRRAAADRAEATRLRIYEVRILDLKLEVSESYDRVLLYRRQLELAELDLELAQDVVRRIQSRLAAGDVTDLAVLRAQVEAGQASNRVTEVRNDLAAAEAALNTLLARDPRSPLILAAELAWQDPKLADRAHLRELAMERRPELLGGQRARASAEAAKGAAHAGFLPDVTLGVHRQSIRQPSGEEGAWRFALSLKVPLWLASHRRAQLALAHAQLAQATAEQQAVRSRILLEVEQSIAQLESAVARVGLFGGRVYGEAQRAYDIASRSYAEGKVGYLDLIEARRSQAEVAREKARAQYEVRLAWARLERAVGTQLSSEMD